MAAQAVDLARLSALAALTDEQLGHSEEDLKIRFAVPFLEALGHTRLRFEHKGKDILLRDGLPRGSTVVVETKRPDAALDAHLAQLERYATEERALLAVLTNGHRVRIYSPSWRAPRTFPEALLWDFARGDLATPEVVRVLAEVLSHDVLASEWATEAIRTRQGILEAIWRSADTIRRQHHQRRKELEQRLRQIAKETRALADEQRQCEQELGQLGPHERGEIHDLFLRSGWPLVPSGEFGYVLPQASEDEAARPALRHWRKPKGPEWTEDDFRKNATPYQQRIFAAFVRLGRRSLGIKQIAEETGLSAQSAATALSGFTRLATKWGREPLFEVRKTSVDQRARLGRVYAIVQRHWPTIQRLYRDAARPAAKPPKKPRRKARQGE